MTKKITERPGFERRMTREEINALPIRVFDGPVHIVRSHDSLKTAIQKLHSESVLGFDTESRPAFTKGCSYAPTLLQLAGQEAVYLFQLGQLGFPQLLRNLLAKADIIKAGVAPHYDITKLRGLEEFSPAGFIDLGALAKRVGIKNYGLRGLAAVLLGFRISKKAQVSNWARKTLSPLQVQYAATDAWVGRQIYLRLEEVNRETQGPAVQDCL